MEIALYLNSGASFNEVRNYVDFCNIQDMMDEWGMGMNGGVLNIACG